MKDLLYLKDDQIKEFIQLLTMLTEKHLLIPVKYYLKSFLGLLT